MDFSSINKYDLLKNTLRLFTLPTPNEPHEIYYCLPVKFYNDCKIAIENEIKYYTRIKLDS